MRIIALALTAICSFSASAAEFDSPWKDETAALVIDPFYANSIDWDKLVTEKRVVAVIHKSTIGINQMDPGYVKRKAEALKRGYLWGSYHWGLAGDPEKQADHYIDTVKPGDSSAKLIAANDKNSVLVKLPLWYARYKAKVTDFPSGAWKSYTLWQFSSEKLVQLQVPAPRQTWTSMYSTAPRNS